MHDYVIRDGTIIDGSGAPAFRGDIAIDGDVVTEVGKVPDGGAQEFSADGLLVTPGFVDIHTHFDGQVTWDPLLTPTCWHGVTTVVMGNCGVGFAPVKPDKRDWLIGLMEGVEDIPGSALAEGIKWNWESFTEYLDFVDSVPKLVDIGAQVPHGAVRGYVMGERGARNEPATPKDIEDMAAIVREGIQAGALGFSTSRTLAHRAIDGEPVPGTFAAEDELFGIGRVLGELGTGVFELAAAGVMGEDLDAPPLEVAWMKKLSAEIRRPITFAILQNYKDPTAWKGLLDLAAEAVKEGADLRPQTHGRAPGMLLGLAARHPWVGAPSFQRLLQLPLTEQVMRLKDPELKAQLLSEVRVEDKTLGFLKFPSIFPMQDPPNYEPEKSESIAAIAARENRSEFDVFYDLMLERDGKQIFYAPFSNYTDFSLEPVREMLMHPTSVIGLGDGGAHCGSICDASVPTFMLSYWARDRRRGETLPIEWTIKKQTSDTARAYGLQDRGLLKPGYRADVNVIDFGRLQLSQPELVADLPANGKRFIQSAQGYVKTLIAGRVVMEEGRHNGELPGKLLRGARQAVGER